MKSIALLSFGMIASAIGLVGFCANAQIVDRVVINASTQCSASTQCPVEKLINALEEMPNRIVAGRPVHIVVELCDVDLNLTGHSLSILGNRSLIASPACARGPRTQPSLVPRIYVEDPRGLSDPLFQIRNDNVLFSGFRLEGPTRGIGSGDDRLERGIWISPFDVDQMSRLPEPIRSIEISNMEIFHWSGAGINVSDNTDVAERGRLFNTNEAAVRIKNNFIHHNRHFDGNGYGVEVDDGAYALIEQNVFDENRHAIAGGSSDVGAKDFAGYTLRDNLILSGGGLHCGSASIFSLCWRTHQIDMHGNKSTVFGGQACCGTAGETIIIERNTILYTGGPVPGTGSGWIQGYAIKIRGNPTDKAVVDGNVFKHASPSDAIAQNGEPGFGDNITNPIDVRKNNVFRGQSICRAWQLRFPWRWAAGSVHGDRRHLVGAVTRYA